MANEKIIFDTEVKVGSSVGSVKSLKAELRAVTNELGQLEVGSEAFVKAAQKAGDLQDRIGDVKNTVAAFNPEAKFKALGDAVGIAANGFAAASGAMALMGGESEDLNKIIAQTQGAIALATGLNGLLGMKDAFGLLKLQAVTSFTAIKGAAVTTFTTIKGAILATGIGALVVALGLVINEILKYNEAIDDEVSKQKKLNDELEKNADLMDKTATASEKIRNAKKGGLDDLKREKDLLIAKGATEKEIFEKSQQIAQQELQNLKTKKYSGLEVSKEIADKENEIKVNQLAFDKKIADKKKEDSEKIKANQKRIDDWNKQRQAGILRTEEANREAQKAIDDIAVFNAELQAKEDEKKDAEKRAYAAQKIQVEQERKERELETLKGIAADEILTNQERFDALDELNKKGVISEKEASDAKIAIAEKEQNAKLALVAAYGQTFNQIADLLGKSTAEGKAVAIAATTIDTYVAAFRAYKEGLKLDPTGTFSIIAAAAAAAAGIKAVQNIVNTPVPGNGGGGGGGGGITAPSAPRIPQSFTGTKLGGNSEVITKGNGQVQKVIVTETDITKTQDKVKGIIRKATIR
jgi:hypothetical protein